MTDRTKRTLLTLLASCCGFTLFLAFCYPMLRGNIYQGSDLGAFHLPARSFYSHCLQNGYAFLWWPEQFCGYYIHGEGQVGMYHPVHYLLYRFLPLDRAFNLELASGYAFLYAGMTLLLRRWQLPWFAALFGANLFAFSGFTLIHFIHMQAIEVIAHIPWLLFALDILLKSRNSVATQRAAVAVSLLFASQLLLGYPQYVLFTLMAMALYILAHGFSKRVLHGIVWLSVALSLGTLIGAVQLLPTFDLVQGVQRQHAADFWRSGSLPPVNLLQFAGPYFFQNRLAAGVPPWEYSLYNGMIPLVLGLFLALQWRRLGPSRRLVGLFLVQAALMLVLALGEYGGLYGLLAQLPVVGSFRCSARHIVLIHFALASLGAIAIARLYTYPMPNAAPKTGRIVMSASILIGGIALLAAFALRNWAGEETRSYFTNAPLWLAVGPALLLVAAITLCLALRRPYLGCALLMAFATLDIAFYAIPQIYGHRPQSTPLGAMLTALADELPEDELFEPHAGLYRAHGNWRVARLSSLGLANYMGYVGLPPSWQLDPNAPTTKRIAGVRWEKLPLSARDWTTHKDALPLARLVTKTVVTDNPTAAIEEIDVATTALVESPRPLPEGVPGKLAWLHNRPGDVALRASCETEQLLVLAQRFHPGWTTLIDGRATETFRVNGDFTGCIVPPGERDVRLTFSPRSHRIGMRLSLAGLALLVLWASALATLGKRRPSRPS